MRSIFLRLFPVCALAVLAPYDRGQDAVASVDPKVVPAKVAGSVHSIGVPSIAPPELPDGPNKEVYLSACMICHTPRYVTMQPAFSKKTWTAEVEKMKKVYGAPLSDAQMPLIVDYLMSVRGAATPATKP